MAFVRKSGVPRKEATHHEGIVPIVECVSHDGVCKSDFASYSESLTYFLKENYVVHAG